MAEGLIGEKFQGREFTITLQAPDEEDLDEMIRGMQVYARAHGLEKVEVLERGLDPDGGYRAIIVAHNWNALAWVKKKWEARGYGPEFRAELKTEKEEAIKKARLRGAAEKAYREEYARYAPKPKPVSVVKAPVKRAAPVTPLDKLIYQKLRYDFPEIYEDLWYEGILVPTLIDDLAYFHPDLYEEIKSQTQVIY